jgi:hypothetical protein
MELPQDHAQSWTVVLAVLNFGFCYQEISNCLSFKYLLNTKAKNSLHVHGSRNDESIMNPNASECCDTNGPGR